MNTAFFASPFRLILCLVIYCSVTSAMSRGIRAMVPRLHRATTALLICDVQVKFESLIYRSSSVIDNIALLNGVANILGMPVVATEQYPKVFGPTSKEIGLLDKTPVFSKTQFSMVTEDMKKEFAEGSCVGKTQIVLCGVETHICVLQSALAFLEYRTPQDSTNSYDVFIVNDAVSSQKSNDRAVALSRLKDAGAIITTTESLIFELLGDSLDPQFKAISVLLKDRKTKLNEFENDTFTC